MMHPTLVAALAAERHADLLRAADTHRRAAALTRPHRLTSTTRPSATPTGLGAMLTRLVAALRTRAAASTQPTADLCCA